MRPVLKLRDGLSIHFFQLSIRHPDPRIIRKPGRIAMKEVPIQRIERTGPLAHAGFFIVMAALALIAHAVNVGCTGDIGFGGQ